MAVDQSGANSPVIRDPLTGAYSRALMQVWLEQEVERAGRSEQPFSLIMLDLDNFKSVNDAYGHARGDRVLCELVERVRSLTRGSDSLFRYGGDEFLLLLPNTTKMQAMALGHRVLDAVRAPPFPGTPPLNLTASLGVATFPTDGRTVEALVETSDRRQYQAKRQGRGRLVESDAREGEAAGLAEVDRLLERDAALNAFSQFIDQLPSQRRGAFEIVGGPASGRTRFLREIVALASLHGLAVLRLHGRCGMKFQSFGSLLEAAWPAGLSVPEDVERIPDALTEHVRADGYNGLLIAVDNWTQLDHRTMRWLADVFRRPELQPVAVAYTLEARSVRTAPFGEAPLQGRAGLLPLTRDGVMVLLRNLMRWDGPEAFVNLLAQESGGLPGLVHQGLRLLMEQGALQSDGGHGWLLSPDYSAALVSRRLAARGAAVPHNLPFMPTGFMGRERELDQVIALLGRGRLVTLLGPGGIGKTRLAMEVAAQLVGEYDDGVFFVSLSVISDAALLASTIVHAIQYVGPRREAVFESLKAYLAEKRMLLILDNFEHLMAAAPAVAELLAAAPGLTVLLTSREVLRVSGEQVFDVPPMALPTLAPLPSPTELVQYEAVRLFVERARALLPEFQLSEANAAAVVGLCHRLDGLPMAIELAAGHIRSMSPESMLTRLGYQLRLLAGGPRDLPARQQALRNTFEWSYNLLTPDEQVLFRQLGVFVGGFRLEAAEAVRGVSTDGSVDTLPVLTALLDKSLVRREDGSISEPHYRMLQTIREYALEQLASNGEKDRLDQAHLDYYVRHVEAIESQSSGPTQDVWLAHLEREHDNLRAAIEWALSHGQSEMATRIAGAVWKFWAIHNHLSEGYRWLETALDSAPDKTPARVRALWGAGWIALIQGATDQGARHFEEGARLGRELGEKRLLGCCLHGVGSVAQSRGEYDRAHAAYEESLPLFQAVGDIEHVAWTLQHMGAHAMDQGDMVKAQSMLQESQSTFRELQMRWPLAEVTVFLGHAQLQGGNYDRAAESYKFALQVFEELGDSASAARAHAFLGSVALEQGDYLRATANYKEGLERARDLDDKIGTLWALEQLARVAEDHGRLAWSLRLLGSVEAVRQSLGLPRQRGLYERHLARLAALRGRLGEVRATVLWEEGQRLSLPEVIAHALAQEPSRSDEA